jgi:glyceraldehyde 3-phosphate dehydrogenase
MRCARELSERQRRGRVERLIQSALAMPIPFAINGLGRVGRALLRIAQSRPEIEVVAANDPAEAQMLARLLRHDTVHGRFPVEVGWEAGALILDGRRLPVHQEADPPCVPWADSGARIVVEATGRFRSRGVAASHLGGSVEKVIISAVAEGVDATFCVGINHTTFDAERHVVISNASCTTNCLAPLVRVLHDSFGLEHGLMNTVHCYTNSQNLVDMAHADPRRARAAAANIIPTTSDAIPSIGLVIPEVAGRIDGLAMRVPVAAGSLVDLVARLERRASTRDLAAAFRLAAAGSLAGIMGVSDEELVSADFVGDPRSAVVDLPLLQQVEERLVRVVAWYDNEWGYANRLADLVSYVGERLP